MEVHDKIHIKDVYKSMIYGIEIITCRNSKYDHENLQHFKNE